MDNHEYVHPAFRPLVNAIAPAPEPLGMGPLTPEAPAVSRSFAQAVRNPDAYRYQQLVEAVATEAQGKDWTDPRQSCRRSPTRTGRSS